MSAFELLTRDGFREAVFARDRRKCLVCQAPAADAHHVIERSLWSDGGYYLENGASVCGACHLLAESTEISCEELRRLAKIGAFPLPEHLSEDERYDKWGNVILPNGQRLRGEKFDDPSVQKILGSRLALFADKVKYPRSYHLPFSPGVTKDDRVQHDLSAFDGQRIVVTAKFDGENTSLYRDHIHARSLDYDPHPSRSWVKSLHARVKDAIPSGWRVCGENLYAQHSIAYEHLSDYFQVFSVWTDKNECLSWEDTEEWAALLDLTLVRVLYTGDWPSFIDRAVPSRVDGDLLEGYVARVAASFHYREFRKKILKYVRKGHVQTDAHWKHAKVVPNKLRQGP